ncbi:chemotaxis response regulator protein-glutamate methylesterase [Salinigranum rubrum]|uniref:Protein-glutamate methylesterase/protein-glutamine glutaminase n=1 Tax=Salinigranum rubrum TaxID=755307 RepID=A0A2I8VI10_9EURY|nr:chemotaxis-specific protein-glutamate methyltransferase CheB [Salinigranum rubrum]AUV81568.1 chemotaxis response regulator protein-glutamate methylesterase [Salinigranum rubrum]
MSAAGGTRAVVVDDSRFMRTLITKLLEEGGVDVVADASDGEAAVEVVAEHAPDVVTMDIEMPRKNGIEAVEEIMARCPTPVLMLSAHADENADITFEALDRGAVDFVTKPGGEVTSEMPRVKRELVDKVRSAAAVDLNARGRSVTRTPTAQASAPAGTAGTRRPGPLPEGGTVIIGASTGGPNVVEEVVAALPREADLRILVVQHMPEGFTGRFAKRLDSRCGYEVREARDGERVGPGQVRVAPGGSHLFVDDDRADRLRLRLRGGDRLHGVKPAIDHTMTSAAEVVRGPLTTVLLTGMGRDGVDGMGAVKRAGGSTIAQDERTSAIFGMPKRAIEAGHTDEVLPAHGIAEGILNTLRN